MKVTYKVFAALFGLYSLSALGAGPDLPENNFIKQASLTEKAAGDKMAETAIKALGGIENYRKIRVLSFEFIVEREGKILSQRSHHWDKHAGISVITGVYEGKKFKTHLNINDKTGRVWLENKPVADPEQKSKLLELAYAWWINDSFWLVSPFKFFDGGVIRATIDGQLRTTFENVGLTPGDAYFYQFDKVGNIQGWQFRLQSKNRGNFQFEAPTKLHGVTFFKDKTSPRFSIKHGEIKASLEAIPQLFQ